MERAGIKVDERILGEMARELAAQIREAELAVYNAVGHQFTINSTQQLARVLVEELHLPLTKRTKTGYSTDATVLEELAGAHPVIEHILRYRQLTKLKSTYVDALPALINPRTGRVHTTFNQAVAATGRLSSENPNLQNIPVRTELGRAIRRAFVAEGPDAVLFAADYAQIELRIAAHITRDPCWWRPSSGTRTCTPPRPPPSSASPWSGSRTSSAGWPRPPTSPCSTGSATSGSPSA